MSALRLIGRNTVISSADDIITYSCNCATTHCLVLTHLSQSICHIARQKKCLRRHTFYWTFFSVFCLSRERIRTKNSISLPQHTKRFFIASCEYKRSLLYTVSLLGLPFCFFFSLTQTQTAPEGRPRSEARRFQVGSVFLRLDSNSAPADALTTVWLQCVCLFVLTLPGVTHSFMLQAGNTTDSQQQIYNMFEH